MREFLLWCLPALVVGFAVRAVLTAQLPYAVYHDDTGDLMVTPHMWVKTHHLEIAGKKTFLVPIVYTIFVLLRLPLLLVVPAVQHVMGLFFILMVGLLCRLWFAWWRIFILPITLIIAIDPALLWYEHLLMPESVYVFFTVMLALAGTLYALRQSHGHYAFLCVALFLEAGSRPEGKLLFGFAFLLLTLMHWGKWRAAWLRFVIMVLLALGTFSITHTAQAGLLLYTSVARMTPASLKCAPGFETFIAPVRAELQKRWDYDLSFPRVADRRAVSEAVESYLKSRAPNSKHLPSHEETNAFCMRLAKETCLRNFFNLPEYFYQKFRFTVREPSYGMLDQRWLFERQKATFFGHPKMMSVLSARIAGVEIRDDEEYAKFLDQHYREIGWFNRLADTWNDAVFAIRFPDEVRGEGRQAIILRRLPIFYLFAPVGLLLVMLRRGPLQPFHVAWGLTLLALFYTIILTANVRGRFRFNMEPFWYLYMGLLFDMLAYWLFWKHRAPTTEPAPASVAA